MPIFPTKHLSFFFKKHKKNVANKREITFEKFRVLQSDTVAVATLYQKTISISRMGVLCSPPLSAWQVRLYHQPRRWTTSYPTRPELRR